MKKGQILVLSYEDRTKIGSSFDFLLHFNSVVKLCSKFQLKILQNVGENRRKDQFWSYLGSSFLA